MLGILYPLERYAPNTNPAMLTSVPGETIPASFNEYTHGQRPAGTVDDIIGLLL
jgi:hypothetical protein